jgi:predicted phage terminase large subunit-like protein
MDKRLMQAGFASLANLIRPMALVKGQRTPEQQSLVDRCKTDFELFIREFFPTHFWGDLSPMHQHFCDLERTPDRRGLKYIVAAPRGNAKTTFRVTIKAIHAIVYGYERFIVVIGYSSNEAVGKIKDIRDQLTENQKLIDHYGLLIRGKAGSKEFVTTNGVKVVGRGRGGQVRGLRHRDTRPTLVICDDIEDTEKVNTPEQREKTEKWFTKDVLGALEPDGSGNVIFCGTVLHAESLLATFLKKPGWLSVKFQSIINWPERVDLWDEWGRLYSDLSTPKDDREAIAQQFYQDNKTQMEQGAKVLWPGGEPLIQLMEYKIQNGLASLYSEKQNDPYDPDKQLFNPDNVARFAIERIMPTLTNAQPGYWIINGNRRIHSSKLNTVIFHDPAMAEAKKSDYAAIVVCAQDDDGYVYVLSAWVERAAPSVQIAKALDLVELWGADEIFLESNGFQGLMRGPYQEAIKERTDLKGLYLTGVTQHQNKQKRISTLEPYFANGWILFHNELSPVFIDQLRQFPTGHDDGPDALQGAVSRLRLPIGGVMIT